jgi:wobble nucleotide-excising tRNase
VITVHSGETELSIQLPSSHPLTAPVHPPERVTGPPELHHSKGRYRLDLNRKQQTRTILKRVYSQCEQLIVLAHDAHFIRNFRDDIVKSGSPQDVACIKLKTVSCRYSNFDAVDIDKECEGAYFKCHRILGDYLDGTAPSSMEVARSIRRMLEGYLHRRFVSVQGA